MIGLADGPDQVGCPEVSLGERTAAGGCMREGTARKWGRPRDT